jgi:hypothetical protein
VKEKFVKDFVIAKIPLCEKKEFSTWTNVWLLLTWTSTVVRNRSLASAANLTIYEKACCSQWYGYTLSFLNRLWFGFPTTLVVTAIGLLLIRGYWSIICVLYFVNTI